MRDRTRLTDRLPLPQQTKAGPQLGLFQGSTGRTGRVERSSPLVLSHSIEVASPAREAFRPIQRIGGQTGWYYGNWLWRLRGWLDELVGGVGLQRGRRDTEQLSCGDTLDCWQVETVEPGRLLRLASEMKLPGRGWLQFEVVEREGGSTIRQAAIFEPAGLFGVLYWYALHPLHRLVFTGMLQRMARIAEAEGKLPGSGPQPPPEGA